VYVKKVANLNYNLTIKKILEQSPIHKEMNDNKQIAVIGGMYDVDSGAVEFFEDENDDRHNFALSSEKVNLA